ncbi:tRNA (adenosine(37)-N6)-threonylcarbamoyltransferase complex dimerization subunit type 1 TsaB [Candidatus Saccharibacteria bacterium]|nr:tRNA (adenosine(37)-N6)-threonylcarbamoyltransferase complex dimerization subunit type 1 TsaB [Candidatus Saccharibacteria bacterium]MBQ9017376.1 tRNA (adenosine(37)-N6)-threonylcarbamoyltransferase complex dimerization subunit type 1 TsaB [Candidatus Saccharibacteria bacterium]
MKLYLDTSDQNRCVLMLDDQTYEWEAKKELAEKLLKFIKDKLAENGKTWQDLTEITFFSGPGSFTGLRIGAAIVNTLATELQIPLYNQNGEKLQIVIPDYGRAPNIGTPRK